jgi:hypothetical protein
MGRKADEISTLDFGGWDFGGEGGGRFDEDLILM